MNVCRICIFACGKFAQQDVDFRRLEPYNRHVEIQINIDQLLDFESKEGPIPARVLGKFVVGDDVGTYLVLRHVFEADRRDQLKTKLPCGRNAPVTGNNAVMTINEDRVPETKMPDAFSNLPDLFRRMCPRIIRPVFERTRGLMNYLEIFHWGSISFATEPRDKATRLRNIPKTIPVPMDSRRINWLERDQVGFYPS